MKKQSVARVLVRELQARMELERSLGAEFASVALPPIVDLSRTLDPVPDESDRRNMSKSRPGLGERMLALADSVDQAVERRAGSAAARDSELGEAAGGALTPFADLPTISDRQAAMSLLCERALDCKNCQLCEGRRHVVFGEGALDASLVFVGEAPGRDEDLQGKPFVGRAGELLTAMVEKGMQMSRDSVYICNILKCRPPHNRDPEPDEVRSCAPYLHEQLNIIRPKLIITLGRVAAQILTGERTSMRRLRGNLLGYRGIRLLPIYHPAYLLRARQRQRGKTDEDRQTWRDLQLAMKILAE